MLIKESAKIALRNFKRHKVRAFLSILGIVIGILSVSLILSLGQGVKEYITDQISAFGTDIISVATKIPDKSTMGSVTSMVQGIMVTSLKKEDFEAMAKFDFVTAQTSYNIGMAWANYREKENDTLLFAASYQYIDIDEQAKIAEGRFYNEQEGKASQRVIVLGKDVKENLFGEQLAIGKSIKVKGQAFKVIGVLQGRGQMAGFNYDNLAMIPLKTGLKTLLGVDHVVEGLAKIKPGTDMPLAVSRIESLLRRRHNISDPSKDDFQVMSMAQALEIVQEITMALNMLLIFLASISLLVGGVGIMDVMLASLSERMQEVGLRKALGATDKNIKHQFLIESALLTSIGGIIGVILAFLFTLGIGFIMQGMGMEWEISFPLQGAILALLISIGIGFLFGLYPARKAARLEPIVALQKE